MITIIERKITKNYGTSKIENVWVEYDEESNDFAANEDILDSMQTIKNSMLNALESKQDSIICLYTSCLNKEILDYLSKIDNSNRIYIYTKNQNILEELSHRFLIREGEYICGNFFLIRKDNEIQGFFSTNNFKIESNQLFLELDSKECNEFWHYFIACFWKSAKIEYIAGSKEEVSENNQQDFMPPFENGFDIEFIEKEILESKERVSIQLVKNSPLIPLLQDFENCSFLLQDPKVFNDETLKNKSDFYVANVGFDAIDANIYISDTILLYRIQLNDEQKAQLKKMQNSLIIKQKFRHSIALQDLIDKTLHYLDGRIVKVEQNSEHKDYIQCDKFLDKEEFEKQELEYEKIWQEEYPHNCEITYKFAIIPFYTPNSFKEAQLYNEWKETHKSLHKEIDKALSNIESILRKKEKLNKFQAILGEAKNMFIRFFLGKDNNLQSIKNKLLNTKEKALPENLDIVSMQKYIKDLEENIKIINENSGEIDLKLDEAEKHNEWQEKKNKLIKEKNRLEEHCKKERENIETQQKECENKRAKIENEQKELQKEYENKDKQIKQAKNESENSKDSEKQIKQQRRDIDFKISNLNKDLKELDSKIKDCEKKEKDNKAFQQNINTKKQELQKNENKLNSLKNDLKNKYEKFHYDNTEQKKSKGSQSSLAYMNSNKENHKSTQYININIPKENRPSIGTLKEDGNKRLLEISLWSEVEAASKEADKLRAKLSVKQS